MALAAIAAPMLLVYRLMPSTTFFSQATALLGWAAFLSTLARFTPWPRMGPRTGLAALLLALVICAAHAIGSVAWANLPTPLALSSLGMIAAAGLTALVAAGASKAGRAGEAFFAVCVALVVAAALNVSVSVIQVFAPNWADGTWIAPPSFAGRASGNLRQPNHLSSLMLWATIAVVWLVETERIKRAWGSLLALAFTLALVLASSRTGALGVILLALWGLLDRRLSRHGRATLLLSPIAYLLFFVGLTFWAHATQQVFGGQARIGDTGDSPNSRWHIWSNALALIAQHPWTGVGFGEFNLAWTLTPFPQRPTAFFDHAHNLPLHLAVELGVPLATLVLLLAGYSLWRAFIAGCAAAVGEAKLLRAAFVMVLMIALHSLVEYPLWYAYFLLPTAFLLGLCLGTDVSGPDMPALAALRSRPSVRPLLLGCVLMLGGGALAVIDYLRVARIFSAGDGLPPLSQRIEIGQRSWFFAHHAAYAAVTTDPHPSRVMRSFDTATHYLLDTRLMRAWAVALHESGDPERARYVAQRLREFRHEDSKDFFDVCKDLPAVPEPPPFQCAPPARQFDYRDFR